MWLARTVVDLEAGRSPSPVATMRLAGLGFGVWQEDGPRARLRYRARDKPWLRPGEQRFGAMSHDFALVVRPAGALWAWRVEGVDVIYDGGTAVTEESAVDAARASAWALERRRREKRQRTMGVTR